MLGPETMQEKRFSQMSDQNSNLLVKILDRPGIRNLEMAFEKRLCHWGLVVAEPAYNLGHKNYLLDTNARVFSRRCLANGLRSNQEKFVYDG